MSKEADPATLRVVFDEIEQELSELRARLRVQEKLCANAHVLLRSLLPPPDPAAGASEPTRPPGLAALDGQGLAEYLDAAERFAIHSALKQTGGRKAEAARLLGISRKNLWEKMRKCGIDDDSAES